jgi:hypothetical protein
MATDITAETPAQAQAAMAPVAVKRATAPGTVKPASAAERFQADTADHEMTVLHDDGLYRHLRFKHPEHGFHWFDLITWPGSLAINGDMGSYLFSRDPDMFEFFRGHRANLGYWAEKLRAPRADDVEVYSENKFREHVMDAAKESEEYYPGLTEAAEEYFFGEYAEWNTKIEGAALAALDRFYFNHPSAQDDMDPFTFSDTFEWNLSDWSHFFAWCCHAIPWGIAQYDKAKTATSTAAGAAAL